MKIEFHPDAQAELDASMEYYERQQPGLSNRFWAELEEKLVQIAERPMSYRDYGGYRRASLKIFPFYIAFSVDTDAILVWAIAHMKRRPTYWLNRMKYG